MPADLAAHFRAISIVPTGGLAAADREFGLGLSIGAKRISPGAPAQRNYGHQATPAYMMCVFRSVSGHRGLKENGRLLTIIHNREKTKTGNHRGPVRHARRAGWPSAGRPGPRALRSQWRKM